MTTKVFGVPAFIWRRLCVFNIVLLTLLASVVFALQGAHAQGTSSQNCDANAVIWCGATSPQELANKYASGDGHNSAASIQAIYGYFGVDSADITAMQNASSQNNSSTSQGGTGTLSSSDQVTMGSVTRAGNVYDSNGKLVATNALTGGRQDISGSTRVDRSGTVFYVRPPSVSFAQNRLTAFVVMQNGRFAFAIITSCGNAVKATPVAPKPTPKPTPATTTHTTTTPAPQTAPSVCSGNTTNSNTGTAAQGGNCSTNTTVVEQSEQPAPAPQPVQPTAQVAAAPAAPTTLVNTGPGSLIGVFAGTSIAGSVGYGYFLRRKVNQL